MCIRDSSTPRKAKITTRSLVVTAMLSAVAFVLMFVEFPIPMLIPSFVKMDISDLPALLGSFALGPVYGVVIELLKNLLHIIFKGTSSAYVGEIFNFSMGAVLCLSAGLIYHFKKDRKGAVIASLVGCAVMAILSVPFNYFMVYPAYVAVSYTHLDVYKRQLCPGGILPGKLALPCPMTPTPNGWQTAKQCTIF